MRVLLVDDNPDLCRVLEKHLLHRGNTVDIARDGQKGLRMALSDDYDIILLDIMMPQMNGYKVLEHLRAEGRKTPVILITAKNDDSDFIKDLEMGADDFIQKPFHMDILFAKMRALARRTKQEEYDGKCLHYADLTLCCESNELVREDQNITLSPEECDLLHYMIENSSVVIPAEKMAKEEEISAQDEPSVCRHVERLQEILQTMQSEVRIITIRGVGYKLCV